MKYIININNLFKTLIIKNNSTHTASSNSNGPLKPITPHANLAPAFPVVRLSGCSVYPRSSSFA